MKGTREGPLIRNVDWCTHVAVDIETKATDTTAGLVQVVLHHWQKPPANYDCTERVPKLAIETKVAVPTTAIVVDHHQHGRSVHTLRSAKAALLVTRWAKFAARCSPALSLVGLALFVDWQVAAIQDGFRPKYFDQLEWNSCCHGEAWNDV
jgi:hypothetical protein